MPKKKQGAKKDHKRDMWANIPWQRRAEIVEEAKQMPDGMRRTIVLLAFEDGMSTAEIADEAKSRDDMISRNHRPVSKRRVLQIIAEEVPDYNAYQIHREPKHREGHTKFIWHNRERGLSCANCGARENLEWHHMIPAFLGGTAEPENMICLCEECHSAVTAYARRLFPERFGRQRSKD